MANPTPQPKLKKRVVSYWLICMGTSHGAGKGNSGVISPGVEHYHRADPYLVRCASCAELEKLK